MHYLQGIPIKRVEDMFGNALVEGNLIKLFHKLAKKWVPVVDKLKEEYRNSEVRHADETGWQIDGKRGYSWLFCTEDISLFSFKNTRSSEVPKEIMKEKSLSGVLVVDRYGGYNKMPCKLQYCYAHLLRDLQDLEKKFPKEKEIKKFVSAMAPLLSKAMALRIKDIPDKKYYERAKAIKEKIVAL